MAQQTFYWYDYESFGVDPRRDRAAQFAGLRTNETLEPVGEPLVMYCQPADDFLPSPESCLITHITPQLALEKGVPEVEFIGRIHAEFSRAATCVAGYNSIRFDDELTRQLLYRNFYDPYEREWKSGNSRWDIIDMLRLCAATRPEGIQWPLNEQGNVSFKLEALTRANGIHHTDAHDALADVEATVAMARLVRQHQPRLYDYVLSLRSKHQVEAQLDLMSHKPLLHVSSLYPASQGCLALVSPLCRHPSDSNGVIVYDLRMDPAGWQHLPAEEIQRRVFSRQEDLAPDESRIPLRVLHVNRCPVVAPAATLEASLAARYGIDLAAAQSHWQSLKNDRGLSGRLAQVFGSQRFVAETDPDFMIYSGGFFGEGDRRFMSVVRESTPEQLAKLNIPFKDARLPEMLLRYRARNFPWTLDADERRRWDAFRRLRLCDGQVRVEYTATLEAAQALVDGPEDQAVLDAVRSYVRGLWEELDSPA